jgi:asparaginyl-tRNA synthetase
MKHPQIRTLFSTKPEGQTVTVNGWVRTKREAKNLIFLAMNDGSHFDSLQIVVDRGNTAAASAASSLTTGASVQVIGRLVESEGSGQTAEVQAEEVILLGDAAGEDYPLQKKRHSFEFLREISHLRSRTNSFGAVTRIRNILSYAVHRFFQERGFYYINTPIITASDAEGAGAMFQVTTLDLDRIKGKVDYSQDFFGKRTGLTVSGQLEAETYACALSRVYTFGPTFRAENSNTARHLAEFWMIEPEMAFCDINCDMDVAEDFIKYLIDAVLTEGRRDMEFFDARIEKGIIQSLQKVAESPFHRITYTEAVDELLKAKKDFEYPVSWGADLQSEYEKYLTDEVYEGPVIVTDYPREIKAFYMKQNDDGKTVRAMDVLVPRLGEIIGGSEREADYRKLVDRMTELNLNPDDYWWYLDLRRYGTVPHAGFGLGFERMVQYVTGMQNIRDVIPFPRSVNNAKI